MSDLPLTLAIGDYVHTRELAAGRIKPEGIDLRVLNHPFELIAYRFLASQEWEVSEFSLATYCTFVAQGNSPMIGLPIFPSRVFRHGSIYVPRDSNIKSAADLKGKRIGIPQWTQTAVTYVRGWLQHDIGVPLTSIEWIQAGVNDAGRKEMAKFDLPPGFQLTSVQDKSLNELLLNGGIDAVITARPPDVFLDGKHGVKRLIADYREQELKYFQQDRHLSDHARRGDAPRRVRGEPLDRAQSAGGVREGQARLHACALPGTDLVPADGLERRPHRADQPRAVPRWRSLALRHREEPQDAGAVPRLLPRAGRDEAQAHRRGAVSEGSPVAS